MARSRHSTCNAQDGGIVRAVVFGMIGLVACSQSQNHAEPVRQTTHPPPDRTLVQQDVDAIIRGMQRAHQEEIVEQIAPR